MYSFFTCNRWSSPKLFSCKQKWWRWRHHEEDSECRQSWRSRRRMLLPHLCGWQSRWRVHGSPQVSRGVPKQPEVSHKVPVKNEIGSLHELKGAKYQVIPCISTDTCDTENKRNELSLYNLWWLLWPWSIFGSPDGQFGDQYGPHHPGKQKAVTSVSCWNATEVKVFLMAMTCWLSSR